MIPSDQEFDEYWSPPLVCEDCGEPIEGDELDERCEDCYESRRAESEADSDAAAAEIDSRKHTLDAAVREYESAISKSPMSATEINEAVNKCAAARRRYESAKQNTEASYRQATQPPTAPSL